MARIKRIGVQSFVKLRTVFVAGIGLIAGILYSLGGLVTDALVSFEWLPSEVASTPGLSYGTVLAFGALIGMPIMGGIVGIVLGLAEVFAYNMIARLRGGIDLDLDVDLEVDRDEDRE